MNLIFSTLNLSPLEIGVITISGLGFIVMFGLASAKGGYQDLNKTTLGNDEAIRAQQKKKK